MAGYRYEIRNDHARAIGAIAVFALFAWVAISYVVGAGRQNLITDDGIANAIQTEIQFDGAMPPHAIQVRALRGIVTLSGTVDNLLARERATALASAIRGVRAVVNDIDVSPSSRADDTLEVDARAVLGEDPVAGKYDVNVSVVSGTAVLTGAVRSYAEKELAGELVRGVRGLRMLVNEITVQQGTVRTDRDLWTAIFRRLSLDARLRQSRIDLTVADGHVTLAGTVPSVAQRSRAAARAWLPGVKSVDVSQLRVSWDPRETDGTAARTAIDDGTIKVAVQDALYYDPRVLSFTIYPRVRDGVVFLSGYVDNYRAKIAAEDDARSTMGVWLVKNNIKVKATSSPIDEDLQQQIMSALVLDPYIEPSEVQVRTIDGIAYIEGVVGSAFARERVEKVAARVRAVTGVVNKVCCEAEHPRLPDRTLENRIKAEITWSPFVHGDQITVQVAAGVVTLSGSVVSMPERQEAEQMAQEAGAAQVRNRIEIASATGRRRAFANL